jgi:hypothetical protein
MFLGRLFPSNSFAEKVQQEKQILAAPGMANFERG